MRRDSKKLLLDMQSALRRAQQFVRGKNFDD